MQNNMVFIGVMLFVLGMFLVMNGISHLRHKAVEAVGREGGCE